jgi:ankyrin repeat protein
MIETDSDTVSVDSFTESDFAAIDEEPVDVPVQVPLPMDHNGRTALMLAAMNGHSENVKLLIKHDINAKDMDGHTALMYAAMNGHYECVKLLLEYEADIHIKDKNGYTALLYASENGYTECVNMLYHIHFGTIVW